MRPPPNHRLVAGVNLYVYQLWQLEGVNSCTNMCHTCLYHIVSCRVAPDEPAAMHNVARDCIIAANSLLVLCSYSLHCDFRVLISTEWYVLVCLMHVQYAGYTVHTVDTVSPL